MGGEGVDTLNFDGVETWDYEVDRYDNNNNGQDGCATNTTTTATTTMIYIVPPVNFNGDKNYNYGGEGERGLSLLR